MKQIEVYTLKKQVSKIPNSDTYDIDANIDTTLTYQENYSKIMSDLKKMGIVKEENDALSQVAANFDNTELRNKMIRTKKKRIIEEIQMLWFDKIKALRNKLVENDDFDEFIKEIVKEKIRRIQKTNASKESTTHKS